MKELTWRNFKAEKARHGVTTQDIADLFGITRQAMTDRIMGKVDLRLWEAVVIVDYFNAKGSDVTIEGLFFE
jgi:DNA-binding XRE family transcriptional regulator